MSAVAITSADMGDLVAAVERSRALYDAGDIETARLIAAGAYAKAKAAAGYAEKVKATRGMIDKARQMQGEAVKIESLCTIAMADAVDAAQDKGEIAKKGRPKNVGDENIFRIEDAGLDRQQLHHARKLRDQVREEPGFVERIVEERLSHGLEPSRRSLAHAIGTRSASAEDKGDQLYETPGEATVTLLALESFSATVKEPAVGRGAILQVLEAAGYEVVIADLRDRGIATQHGELQQVGDFLLSEPGGTEGFDIVTNPPYDDLANKFLAHALRVHRPRKMAALLNLNFLCGFDDPDRRFVMDENPPSRVYVFTRRLPMMHRDGWTGPKASSQMNTAWFVWEQNVDGSYGVGHGRFETIRVDWKLHQHLAALAPGAGGHAAPMVFSGEDDLTRETPRKTLDERVEEDIKRAIRWMRGLEPFDNVMLRRGIGVRDSVAVALIEAMAANGLIRQGEDGLWMPTGEGLSAIVTIDAGLLVEQWKSGNAVAA